MRILFSPLDFVVWLFSSENCPTAPRVLQQDSLDPLVTVDVDHCVVMTPSVMA